MESTLWSVPEENSEAHVIKQETHLAKSLKLSHTGWK